MTLDLDSLWFEVALVCGMTAFGSIFMGHFEEGAPRWRRALKLLLIILLTLTITSLAGRIWTLALLGLMLLAVLYIHIIWLPKKGINGWTGEPRDKYYELRGWKKKGGG
jgi:Ca2+/Na+ antiporter